MTLEHASGFVSNDDLKDGWQCADKLRIGPCSDERPSLGELVRRGKISLAWIVVGDVQANQMKESVT